MKETLKNQSNTNNVPKHNAQANPTTVTPELARNPFLLPALGAIGLLLGTEGCDTSVHPAWDGPGAGYGLKVGGEEGGSDGKGDGAGECPVE
jgi:hypothetical protein